MSRSIATTSAVLFACLALPSGPCLAQQATAAPPTAATRFAALDANHDGVLSQYEYDSDAVLAALDTDHNHMISADELQVFLGPEEQGAPSAVYRVSVADTNGDGQLSDEELRRGLKLRFDWLDANKDGNVDLDELKAGFGVPMLR